MIRCKFAGKIYVLYGDKEEAESYGERVTTADTCAGGDYVESMQGVVLPVIRVVERNWEKIHQIVEFPFTHYNRYRPGYDFTEYRMPYVSMLYIDRCLHDLAMWEKVVAEKVALRMDIKEAIRETRGEYNNAKLQNMALALVRDKSWMDYMMRETMGSQELRKKLEDRGLGLDRLADEVLGALDGVKVPAPIRLWALNTLKEQFVDTRQPSAMFIQNNITGQREMQGGSVAEMLVAAQQNGQVTSAVVTVMDQDSQKAHISP